MYKVLILDNGKYGEQVCVFRQRDNAHISSDPLHPDYVEYQAWIAEGNTPEEWQPESENQ